MNIKNTGRRNRLPHVSHFRKFQLESLESRIVLTTFTVTSTNDALVAAPGDAPGTLRQAIFDANNTPGDDDIVFDGALAGQAITLTMGQLEITEAVRLLGTGMADTIIDASSNSRIFDVSDGAVSIRDLTVRNGVANEDGGAIRHAGDDPLVLQRVMVSGSTATTFGGGLSATNAMVTLIDSQVSGNRANDGGGGIYAAASVILNSSTVASNSTTGDGGGIYVSGATLTTDLSTISNNFSSSYGGGVSIRQGIGVFDRTRITSNTSANDGAGVFVSGFTSISRSTVDNNSAGGAGGGLAGSNDLQVLNSTISQNSATTLGGGVFLSLGELNVAYSTVAENFAADMGGGLAGQAESALTVSVTSSILAGNQAANDGPDILSPTDPADLSITYSLVGDNTGSSLDETMPATNLIGTAAMPLDPLLGPLADNGGSTPTHELLDESPAIDAGDPAAMSGVGMVPGTDQRASIYVRVADGGSGTSQIDLGAFEVQTVSSMFLRVTTTDDELDVDLSDLNDISLREAVFVAELRPGADEITFAPELAGSAINLTLGELVFADDLTVTGLGADQLTIDAGGTSRIFNHDGVETTFTLSDLTLTGGSTADEGGAIRSLGYLSVSDTQVFGNSAANVGGGVYALASVNVSRMTITDNSAGTGGGVATFGSLTVDDSTIASNSAGVGGGVYAYDGVIANSTISGNVANGSGGGIYGTERVEVRYSTVHQNSASQGGGIAFYNGGTEYLTLSNAIVAGNAAIGGADFDAADGVSVDANYSLIGDPNATTLDPENPGNNLIGTEAMPLDPMLGPLQNNGGLFQTHALLGGSPAVDAGDPAAVAGTADVPLLDQRGSVFTRVADAGYGSPRIDIGAYEQQMLPSSFFVVTTPDDELDADLLVPDDLSLREAIALANVNPGVNEITFSPNIDSQTISLQYGEILITESVNITGNGEAATVVDGQQLSRLLNIDIPGETPGNVAITAITLQNGSATLGGALYSVNSDLQLADMTVASSSASMSGGGVYARPSHAMEPANVQVTLSGTTLSDNSAMYGGGLTLTGTLNVTGSSIVGNSAYRGGGLLTTGSAENADDPATITNTTISGNSVSGIGGGVAGSQLNIYGSQISNNTAMSSGGGFAVFQRLNLVQSTISSNVVTSGSGGGFAAVTLGTYANYDPSITVRDSTLSGNSASVDGGGFSASDVQLASPVRINQSTLSGNSAGASGGGAHVVLGASIELAYSTITGNVAAAGGGLAETTLYTITGSIIAQNMAATGQDIFNPETQYLPSGMPSPVTYSLVGNADGSWLDPAEPGNNLLGSGGNELNAVLGVLADNGGPTHTHLPMSGSPAIDAGDPAAVAAMGAVPEFDQRGTPFVRVVGARIDMGAVETNDLVQIDLVVTTADDELDVNLSDPDDLSLREAIALANLFAGEDMITFDPELTTTTFVLSMGEIEIAEAVSITGLGVTDTVIDGQSMSRLFHVTAAEGSVTFASMAMMGGSASGNGGAINSAGDVNINSSRITGNSAMGSGGAVYAYGYVTIADSVLNQNTSGMDGGAVASETGAVAVSGSTFDSNVATGAGGAISSMGATLQQSTVSNNSSGAAGGAVSSPTGSLSVVSSTLSGNSAASDGGAIASNDSAVTVQYSTLFGNSSGGIGGGLSIATSDSGESLSISHSIVAGNTAATDASDFVAPGNPATNLTVSYSLIGDETGTSLDATMAGTNLIGTAAAPLDPVLGPLQDNGGPTFTHAPVGGSPAFDAGDPAAESGVGEVPEFDQRGMPFGRVFGTVDIGAIEVGLADFGDAPGAYPDAYHFAFGPQLGALRDAEPASITDVSGPIGDDMDNEDDEDGVTLTDITVGQMDATATVNVVGGDARLDAWIDFNGDSTFSAEEQIATNLGVVVGDNSVMFSVPEGATQGQTVARFRLSTTGGLTADGGATDGEVEDHGVMILGVGGTVGDFGDAPAPFPTLLADDGARHSATGPTLGSTRDDEADGTPSAAADGDDAANADDEDGVTVSTIFAGALSFEIVVNVQNSGESAFLDAWIDLDANGEWSAEEQIANALAVTDGDTTLTVQMPDGSTAGQRVARFRVSSQGDLEPTGAAADGEVEDHIIEFTNSAWHNLSNPVDVDNMDGSVPTPFDANAIITELTLLNVVDPVTFEFPEGQTPPPFFDVNNNGVLDPVDPLLVINSLPSNNAVRAPLSAAFVRQAEDMIKSYDPAPVTNSDEAFVRERFVDVALSVRPDQSSPSVSLDRQEATDAQTAVDELFALFGDGDDLDR